MNPIFDLVPWLRIHERVKTGDLCLALHSDGLRDPTPGVEPESGPSSIRRLRPAAPIAPPLGGDLYKISIQRHGTVDAA